MLKCKSKIAGLETSLESVFGLDRSEFGWQHIAVTAGPAKENARSANVVRVRGLMKVILSEERRLERVTVPLTCCTSSCR